MDREKVKSPNYRKSYLWVWFIATPIVAFFGFFLVVGSLETLGVVPSIEVQQGDDVPKHQVAKLIEEGIMLADEKIEYFYSEGYLSIMAGGNILTEDKVIAYSKNEDNELDIYEINIADIKGIEIIEAGDFITDAVYRFTDDDDNWVEVWLSVENDGHLKFINALKAKMTKQTDS